MQILRVHYPRAYRSLLCESALSITLSVAFAGLLRIVQIIKPVKDNLHLADQCICSLEHILHTSTDPGL